MRIIVEVARVTVYEEKNGGKGGTCFKKNNKPDRTEPRSYLFVMVRILGLSNRNPLLPLMLLLLPDPSLLSPLGSPFDANPQQRAREETDGGDEREAPAASHAVDHLDDDGRAGGAHQAADEVAGRRRRGGAGRVQVDQHHDDDVEGARQRKADDEEQHERNGQVGFALQRPSITHDGRDPGVQDGPDDLDAGELDGEVPHIVASLDVDCDSDPLGDALVVHVHQPPRHQRRDGAGDSERNKRQSCPQISESLFSSQKVHFGDSPICSSLKPYILANKLGMLAITVYIAV